jgi:hypothetical protein
MTLLGGLLGGSASFLGTWAFTRLTTTNLPSNKAHLLTALLLIFAAIVGFLSGSAIFRRARKYRDDIGLFSGLAGGVAGALIGCAFAISITAAYLSSYSTWPQDPLDQIMVLLSYPVFGSLGFFLGGLLGLVLGFLCGGFLKLSTHSR